MAELTITLNLAGRNYRLTVDVSEEEVIRKAAHNLEGQLKAYAENFGYSDNQDLLAMVALHFAISSLKLEHELHYRDSQMAEKLQEIDKVLSENQPID
ncbi:MAG: cell division protein ZapA [Bacteroidetes bacterium]|nr:cell division protein ZapA [Bacteroidota bacterium]